MRALSLIGAILSATFPNLAHGAWGYQVPAGAAQEVEEHGSCRKITNYAGAHIFIPTNSAGEWGTMYSYPPPGIAIGSCTPKTCPAATFGYCSVPETASGGSAGSCTSGVPGATCSYSCNTGTWSAVSNGCDPPQCNAYSMGLFGIKASGYWMGCNPATYYATCTGQHTACTPVMSWCDASGAVMNTWCAEFSGGGGSGGCSPFVVKCN